MFGPKSPINREVLYREHSPYGNPLNQIACSPLSKNPAQPKGQYVLQDRNRPRNQGLVRNPKLQPSINLFCDQVLENPFQKSAQPELFCEQVLPDPNADRMRERIQVEEYEILREKQKLGSLLSKARCILTSYQEREKVLLQTIQNLQQENWALKRKKGK